MAGARDEPVRIAALEHERAEEGGVLRLLPCLLQGHPLGLAQLIQEVCILLQLGRGGGVDDLNALQVGVRICRLDLRLLAEQDDVRDLLFHAALRRFDDALVLPLAQHDGALLFTRALFQILCKRPRFRDLSAELFDLPHEICHSLSFITPFLFFRFRV